MNGRRTITRGGLVLNAEGRAALLAVLMRDLLGLWLNIADQRLEPHL
jgi:hypothetical protein